MQYHPQFGPSPAPSVLCLGASGYGTHIGADQAWQLLDAFAAEGGNFVDTARVYGAWAPEGAGASERVLGGWLRDRGMRDRFLVASKGGHPELSSMDRSRLSADDLRADVMASLADLQTDYIDFYFLHRDDPQIPVGEILEALGEHLAAGRIRWLGASNWHWRRIAEAADYARTHGIAGFSANQIGWSLAQPSTGGMPGTRSMDAETYAYHVQTALPLMAYSSQAQGFFTGKLDPYRGHPPGPDAPSIVHRYGHTENYARLDRARLLAEQLGCEANHVALAYLFCQPFPVVPIVGCRTTAQVRASCAAATLRLTPEQLAFLGTGDPAASAV